MTTYRVGQAGATVFTETGEPLYRLTPGLVVVEGTIDVAASAAAQHKDLLGKRVWRYADKAIRPDENKGAAHG